MYIDSHIHIALMGERTKEYRDRILMGDLFPLLEVLKNYKNKNIIYLRDGGDRYGISLKARELGKELGIVLKTPVYAFSKKGKYGNFLGIPISGMDDFNREFNNLLKLKPDHFKLIISGIVDFNCPNRVTEELNFKFDEIYYMIQKAKDKNLRVMVHANSSKAVQAAVKAGADTVEHGYFILKEELYLMAENDVIWVPTLSPLGNLIEKEDKKFKNQLENIRRIYLKHIENIKEAFKIGVKVAAGSDAGTYGVDHAEGFFNEINHLKKTGLDEAKIMDIAVKNGIRLFL
ncbi:amidohydrolase family protein [Thermovenabulum sp.]|uniref:amidohydrolase family protein n=1 Tax=Thermovenabulum sp. TaxID=3100335 RepID=UPI003C7D6F1A